MADDKKDATAPATTTTAPTKAEVAAEKAADKADAQAAADANAEAEHVEKLPRREKVMHNITKALENLTDSQLDSVLQYAKSQEGR